jgi:holo-[acyl-carrier protein] synthase
MSVFSIGVDIADINRVRRMIDLYGDRFVNKVFTAAEIEYCRQKAAHAESFAARFAAKEAVFKAAGSGLGLGMWWKDVEVINQENGKPFLRLHGATAKILQHKRLHLSLSHAGNQAIAMVIVENV